MTITISVNGEQIWTEREVYEALLEDLFDMLKSNGVDDDTAYKTIGRALVDGIVTIKTNDDVMSISIYC